MGPEKIVLRSEFDTVESQLHLIANSIPGLIAYVDAEQSYRFVNNAYKEWIGHTSDNILGKTMLEVLGESVYDMFRPYIEKVLSGQAVSLESDLQRRVGGMGMFRANFVPNISSDKEVLGFVVFIKDVTQDKEIETSLQKLTADMQNAQEVERTRIAREIHDELGQALTMLKMDLSDFKNHVSLEASFIKERILEIMNSVDGLIQSVRDIASHLRPPILDCLGLEAAVAWLVKNVKAKTGRFINLEMSLDGIHIEPAIATVLFRIIQEALTNSVRHTQSEQMDVILLKKGNNISLNVRDYVNSQPGSCQHSSESKFGVLGMKERALSVGGLFAIENNGGTIVRVDIPLKNCLALQ